MSDQPIPSIPISPTPGKDPPQTSSSSPDTQLESFPKLSTSPTPISSTSPPQTSDLPPRKQSSPSISRTSMPPPPIKPIITTHPPSRSTSFHPSLTLPPKLSSNSNLHSPSTTSHQPSPSYSQHHSHSQSQNQGQGPEYSTSTYTPSFTEKEKPRPPFAPFFTLINDVKEKEGETSTYHPRQVHYIFSDDDASEVLSEALLRTLEAQERTFDPGLEQEEESGEGREGEGQSTTTSSSSSATFKKPRGKREQKSSYKKGKERDKGEEREERVLIIDINDTSDGIKGISSLSKDWQVLSASIDNAPTWDGAAEGEDPTRQGSGGLMLRVEGVSVESSSFEPPVAGNEKKGLGESGRGSGIIGDEEIQGLLEGFDRKMAVLRRVVGQQS